MCFEQEIRLDDLWRPFLTNISMWFYLQYKENLLDMWDFISFPFALGKWGKQCIVEIAGQNETSATLLPILPVSQKINNTNPIPCKLLEILKKVQSNSRLAEEFWIVSCFSIKWINSSRIDPGNLMLTARRSNVEGSILGNNTDCLLFRHGLVCLKILLLLQTF